jgi:WD40 repeat protein/tRNA A-37 threonylcarbamoyl transferase component Bud32
MTQRAGPAAERAEASATHPAMAELLAPTADVEAHVASCASCCALARLGAIMDAPPDGADLDEPPTVDPDLYVEREELPSGRGGMGRAIRARDRRLGRTVVLKELPPRAEGEDAQSREALRRRFEREARLTARLDHPAVVGVHEIGRWPDGEPFYAMRFVDGVTLDAIIATRTTQEERQALLDHAIVVADALAYAHDRRIVHRDVKPQNVLVGPFGETVLIDWGIAKDLSAPEEPAPSRGGDDGALTQLGVGTPQYMAPEQARGAAADPRMDVYALGATLYHALAGHPPYDTAGPSVRTQLLLGPPPPLSIAAPDVPLALAAIVEKAMARKPELRFPSARELGLELRRFRSGELTRTHRHGVRDLLAHFARRHRVALRAAAASVVVIVAVVIVAFVRIARERDRTELARRRAEHELSHVRSITASQLALDPLRRIEALELGVQAVASSLSAGEQPDPSSLRGLLEALASPSVITVSGHGGMVRGVDVSADGALALSLGDNGLVRVLDARTGGERWRRVATVPSPRRVVLSPSGARALVYGESALEVVSAAGATSLGGVVEHAAFFDDDRVVSAGERLRVHDVAGAEVVSVSLDVAAHAMAVSRRDRRVALGVGDRVLTWHADEGLRTLLRRDVVALAFVDGGDRLVATTRSGDVLEIDPRGAAPTITLARVGGQLTPALAIDAGDRRLLLADISDRGHATAVFVERPSGAFHRVRGGTTDGRPFHVDGAFVSEPGGDLVLRQPTGGTLARFPLGPIGAQTMRVFSSASTLVVAGIEDDRLALLDTRWSDVGLLVGHSGEITTSVLDPSGDRLATASLDGAARVWDVRTGAALASFRVGAPAVDLAWSPAGDAFAVACVDGVTRVLSVGGAASRRELGSGAPVTALAYSTDGARLVTTSGGGDVVVWDVASGQALVRVKGPAASAVSFSRDGSRLLVGQVDRHVVLRDASSGVVLADAATGSPTCIDGVVTTRYSPDGATVLAGLACGETTLMDAATLAVRRTVPGRPASTDAVSPRGDAVVLVGVDGLARIVSFDGVVRRTLPTPPGRATIAAAFARKAEGRLATVDVDGTVTTWDLSREPPAVASLLSALALGPPATLAVSPDGTRVAVGHVHGGLFLHVTTAEAALARACATLAHFGRTGDAAADCVTVTSRTSARDR